ncbi:MAG: hypothetical protein PUJ11_08750, partial [Eubacteriaceae bacterium]|nr:hypothetical protein [Eubacteriaceae bacterium]
MRERKKLHRMLSILLSFMLVAGMMPAMSMTVFATTTISKVEASGIKVPVPGESVDSSYESVTLPSGQGYEQLGVTLWYDNAACEEPFYGPFAAGQTYYAEVWLDATSGYQFADTSSIDVSYEGAAPYSKEVRTGNARMFFTVKLTCGNVEVIPAIRMYGLKYPMLTQMPVSLDNVECWACSKDGYIYDEVEKLDVTDFKWECTSDNGANWSEFYEDRYCVSDSPIRYGYKYRVSFTVHPKETACGNTLSPLVGDKEKEEKEPYTVFSTVGFSSFNSSFVYKWAECIDNRDGSFTFRSYHYPEEYEIKDISTSMQNYALDKPADSVRATSSTAGIDVSNVELVTKDGSEETKVTGNIEPFKEYWAKVSLSITGDNQKIYEFTDYNHLKNYYGVDSERYIEYRDAIKLNGIKADDIIQDKSSGFSDDYNITVYFKLPMFVSDKATKLSYSSTTYNGKVKSPAVSVVDAAGNKLVKGTDYDVTVPTGRVNAGTYTYKVVFKGNYSGSKTLTLTINQASYTPTVKGYSGTYDGKKHTISL